MVREELVCSVGHRSIARDTVFITQCTIQKFEWDYWTHISPSCLQIIWRNLNLVEENLVVDLFPIPTQYKKIIPAQWKTYRLAWSRCIERYRARDDQPNVCTDHLQQHTQCTSTKSMLIFNGTPALYIYNTEFYLFPVSTTLIPTVIYYVIIALIHAYLNN